MITIIDYGMGNLRSVAKALEHLGQVNQITSDLEEIERAQQLILPGVGAFGDAMDELRRRGMIEPIRRQVAHGRGLALGVLGVKVDAAGEKQAARAVDAGDQEADQGGEVGVDACRLWFGFGRKAITRHWDAAATVV